MKDIPAYNKEESLGKILNDYFSTTSLLEKQDTFETSQCDLKKKQVTELIDTGFFRTSQIAIAYREYTDALERLIQIYVRYAEISDEKIREIIKIIKDKYELKGQDGKN